MNSSLSYVRQGLQILVGSAVLVFAAALVPPIGVAPPLWVGIHFLVMGVLMAIAWALLHYSANTYRRRAASFAIPSVALLVSAWWTMQFVADQRIVSPEVASSLLPMAYAQGVIGTVFGAFALHAWNISSAR